MAQYLLDKFGVTAVQDPSKFHVPSRFEHDIAPDVEAD
jgi:hypothetical protein